MSKPASAPLGRRSYPAASLSLRALACLIGIAAAVGVWAQPLADTCAQPSDDLATALGQEPACTRSAEFMYHLGRLLNRAHRESEALDRLEAAILIEPECWAAHFDYALALSATGDQISAANVLVELSRNPVVDAAIRDNSLRLLENRPVLPQRSRRTVLGLAAGYDDNLMGATRYHNLELTLPEGNVPVELSETQRQRGGRFLKLDISHEADLSIDESANWRYSAFATQRQSVDYRAADLTHFGLQIERAPTQAVGSYSIGVMQQLHRGGGATLRQWQLETGIELSGKFADLSCRFRAGGEFQSTFYPGNHSFDGRYSGLLSHWICPELQLQVQLRAGRDQPTQGERPGGEQRQYALRIARNVAIGSGNLALEYNYYRQNDREGYSALLKNNAPRKLARSTYRLEYRWDMGALSPFIGFEWLDQKANLALFSPNNRVFNVGFRQMF